jgi:hypothetical protein
MSLSARRSATMDGKTVGRDGMGRQGPLYP